MKIKHLLIGMLAMAAAVACKQDEPVEEPVLEVNKTAVALAATAAEGAFEVTANNAWSAEADADWVSLDPANGAGGENAVVVKVTAEDNTAEARTATVTVKSGNLTRTLKVVQAAGAVAGPDLPVSDWAIVGSFTGEGWGWDPAAGLPLYVLDEDYFVLYGLELAEGAQWKFLQGGAWGGAEVGADRTSVEPNTIQAAGSTNIYVTTPGKYDVYLSADATKYYVMSEGKTPAEATEPADAEKTYTVTGTIKDSNWDNMGAAGLMTKEGDYYVAKNVPFVTAAELYGGAEQIEFKVCNTGSWDGAYGLAEDAASPVNTEIAVTAGGEKNIAIAAAAGTYDVYFDEANAKVWVMTQGAKPGETPVQPEKETAQLVTFLSFQSNVASGQNTVTVQLAAEGLSMEPVTSEWGTYDQLVGAGKYLKFDAYSADGTLAAGTYTASAEGGVVKEGEFSIGYDTTVDWGFGPMEMTNWGTCWMTHNADGSETGVKITDGTITVTVEGDVYTITVESSVLEATYVGKLSKETTGGEEPEQPEPGQPELELSDWNIVGSFTGGWNPSAGLALSVLDENYFVYYGLELAADAQWKFLQGTSWGSPEVGANRSSVEPNTIQAKGGTNIYVNTPGTYDIYLAADASKFYVMSEGKTPAEATEPAPAAATYTVTGTIQGHNWDNMAAAGLMTEEGGYYVVKNVPFVTAADLYGGADQLEFKVCNTGSWDGAYGLTADAAYSLNAEIAVVSGGEKNIAVAAPAGAYDVYFDKDNGKVWVMEPGLKPGETPAAPVDVDIDGKQWEFTWSALNASCVIDLGVTEPGVAILAYDMAAIDPEYAGIYFPYMIGTYEITKTDGTSGVVTFTDIDYGETINIPYSNATENSVHFESEALLEENVDCTLATSKIEISMESAEGLADGEYWIIANDKVATPLTSNYGYLQVANAIDGKSYAAHAFTFTQVEAGVYTIQDANGKYYYQTGSYNSFNVSATDGGTDEYLWEVYDTGNGQYAIINYETGKYIQLDSQYGTYGCYAEEKGAMPTLVLADDPVAEPEPGEDVGDYGTNVTCKTVSSAYVDGVATVNGVANVFTLKLGTSKLNGTATITLPAGTTEVTYYAVGWKNTPATLKFSVAGSEVGTQAVAANDGATGNAPYTMTVTESDKYTFSLGTALAADTEVTVETTGSAYRAILFGIQAK